jgi:hypothetical protein
MATSILESRGGCLIPKAADRGYHIVYREHQTNHCPGCGHTHWYIGRTMAECASVLNGGLARRRPLLREGPAF